MNIQHLPRCQDCKQVMARCLCKKRPRGIERDPSKPNLGHLGDSGDPGVKQLVGMGFNEEAAVEALRATHGNVQQAAAQLASPGHKQPKQEEDSRGKSPNTKSAAVEQRQPSPAPAASPNILEQAAAALARAQQITQSSPTGASSISGMISPSSHVSQTLHSVHRPTGKDFGTWHAKGHSVHSDPSGAGTPPTAARMGSEMKATDIVHASSGRTAALAPTTSLGFPREEGAPGLTIPGGPVSGGFVPPSPMNVVGTAGTTGSTLKRSGGGPAPEGAAVESRTGVVDYNQMETNSSAGLDGLPPPRKPPAPKTPLSLDVGSFLDVRDSVGKWLEGEVIKREDKRVKVHFLRWGSKWDEWVQMDDEAPRLSEFHRYSSASSTAMPYTMKDMCMVYAPKPPPASWQVAEICKIDGTQVQVQYDRGTKKYQYWFSIDTDEIRPLGQPVAAPAEPGPNDKWWVGQFVEVKDTIDKWIPAEIEEIKKDEKGEVAQILIHYNGWSRKWDEWLDLGKDKERIRALGSDIEETVEEKRKKEEEEKFRKSLKESTGYEVVDQERDGNCLFRSVAHQIYNDPEKYREVRQKCYDYMERDKTFFSLYVGDDFDEYLKKQRQDKQWGDHVEIVALREMYNKNLEIYDKDSVKAPKPLGLNLTGDHKIPIMRLSYHGANHYNSLVDPKAPPPLGEGADCSVNMRLVRLDEEKKSTPVPRRMSRQHSRVGSIAASQTLFRKVDANSEMTVFPGEEFMKIWRTYEDKEHAGFMQISNLPHFLKDAIRSVFSKKYQRYRGDKVQQEAIHKAYSEVKDEIPELVNKAGSKLDIKNSFVSLADFKTHFYGEMIGDIFWELNK